MNIRLGLTAQAAGTGDAITAAFTPAVASLIDRTVLFVTASAANTIDAPTFSPDGLTAYPITKLGGSVLVAGDILGAGHVLILQYNLASTRWELLNPSKLLTHSTLAQILLNGATTGENAMYSDNTYAYLMAINAKAQVGFNNGSVNTFSQYLPAFALFWWRNASNQGGYANIDSTSLEINHTSAIKLNAADVYFPQLVDYSVPYLDANKILRSSSVVYAELERLSGVTSPIQAQIDALVSGLSWKQAVKCATTANITLFGPQTIDGVSVITGDRVLVKNQSTATENGIYIVNPSTWARSADANTSAKLVSATVAISEGTVNQDKQYVCTNDTITIGSTSITWVLVGGTTYVGTTNRITVIGNVIDLGADAELNTNKTDTVAGNTASSTKYLSVKGYYDYLIGFTWLTDSIFGTWINALTAKTTPVDADTLPISDSANSNKTKKLSFTNLKAFLKTYFDTLYAPKYEIKNFKALNVNLAANTYYLGMLVIAWNVSTNSRRFFFEDAGVVDRVSFNHVNTSNPSNEASTVYLRNHTTATDYLIGTIDWSLCGANAGYMYKFTGLSITVNNTDEWIIKMVVQSMTTFPTGVFSDVKIYNKL